MTSPPKKSVLANEQFYTQVLAHQELCFVSERLKLSRLNRICAQEREVVLHDRRVALAGFDATKATEPMLKFTPDEAVDLAAVLLYALILAVAIYRLLVARLHSAAGARHADAEYMSPLKRNFFRCVLLFGTSRLVGEVVEFSVADDDAGAVFSNRFRVFDCLAQCFFFSTYMSLVLYLVVHSADSERGVADKVLALRVYWVATGVFYTAVLSLYFAECALYGWDGEGAAGGTSSGGGASAASHDPILRYSAGVIALGSIICKVRSQGTRGQLFARRCVTCLHYGQVFCTILSKLCSRTHMQMAPSCFIALGPTVYRWGL